MTNPFKPETFNADGITAPLRHCAFRRIWLASIFANVGALIRGVGAAWAMTQMTPSADKVALVQTALMLPVMLISMPAGAIADMHDRRIVALISVGIAFAGAAALTAFAWLSLLTPNLLLASCFVVGTGMALMDPAWQSSVSEQVPFETLPAAVALNSISYNIARSVGPAVGELWSQQRARLLPSRSTRCFISRYSRLSCYGSERLNQVVCPLRALVAPSFQACAISSILHRSRSFLFAP